jgi:SAM-dependent methyltransferase
MSSDYLLSQGAADVDRLALLNQLFGPSSETLLLRLGLKSGMRVAEIGCGSGNMTCWLAQQVGAGGRVTGVDSSPDSLEQARKLAATRGLSNIDFVQGDVNQLSLPTRSYDLAYCRCVLMHQRQPENGLRQMAALVRSGGYVVCEELDLLQCFFDPPAPHMVRMMELNVAIAEHRGVDYRLGSRLNTLCQKAGLAEYGIAFFTAALLRGPMKRLMTRSFRDFVGKLIENGLSTQEETDGIIRKAEQTDADATTLYGMPLMGQAWSRIP